MSFYSLTSYSQLRVNQTALGGGTPTPPSFADTKSFQFDGNIDYINASGQASGISADNEGTISVWYKPSSLSTNSNIIALTNSSASDVYLIIGWSAPRYLNNVFVQLRNGNTTSGFLLQTDTSPLSVGFWTHIAVVQNGVSAVIYINGIAVPQTFLISNNDQKWLNDLTINEFNIGKLVISSGSFNFTSGHLDEVSYFSSALSSSDILTIFNGGVPNDLNLMSTLPKIWYRMGEEATWNGSKFVLDNQGSIGGTATSVGILPTDPNPTTDVPLFDNKSFTYDGTIDTINIGNTPLNLRFNRSDSFSFSAWVNVNAIGNNVILSNQLAPSTNYRGYYFAVQSNKLTAIFRSTLSDRLIFNGATNLTSGWNHVVFTYDGSATTSGGQLYINGIADTTSGVGTLIGTAESTDQLYIGSRNSADNFFNGNINDTSIFNTELSQSDILTIFNGGLPNDISALSPLGYWRAEQVTFDGTNWTLIDQGSGGNNGTSVSMPLTARTSDVPLFDNKSFAYDGAIDYVDMGNPVGLQIIGALTLSVWVNTSLADSNKIIMKDDNTNRCYSLGLRPTSYLVRFGVFNGGSFTSVSSTSTIHDGNWHHLLAVFNPSTSMKIYVDGVLEATNTTSIPSTIDNDAANFNLGRRGDNTSLWSGNINDTSIFNSELTQSQVTEIYNGGIANDISNLNPLSYWRSEFANWDGSNWTMIDQGSGANNGTSVSMPLTSRTSDVPT